MQQDGQHRAAALLHCTELVACTATWPASSIALAGSRAAGWPAGMQSSRMASSEQQLCTATWPAAAASSRMASSSCCSASSRMQRDGQHRAASLLLCIEQGFIDLATRLVFCEYRKLVRFPA